MARAIDSYKQFYPKDRKTWRHWLSKNFNKSPGIWLVYYKVGKSKPRLPYADMVEEAKEWRAQLVEAVAEYDDNLMEKFFDDPDSISKDEVVTALRKAIIAMKCTPVMCGSAFKNKGVQLVLDGVIDYLPCPTEVNPQPEVDLEGNPTGEFAIVDADKPLRALAFKIMAASMIARACIAVISG